MDVLTAHNANGFLHAVTLDWQAGFGVAFERNMTAQGCTVQRYTLAAYLERQREQQAARQSGVEISHPSVDASTPALPAVGELVAIPSLGEGTVTRILTWPGGEQAALVTSRRGAGLARPGQWTAAAPPVSGDFGSNSSETAILPSTITTASAPAPSQGDGAGGYRMVSLFEGVAS